jgi:hypothetical protein
MCFESDTNNIYFVCEAVNFDCIVHGYPTDGVSTLSWWWGLSAPEILRAMPAVA